MTYQVRSYERWPVLSRRLMVVWGLAILVPSAAVLGQTTFYVRPGGGTPTQCTGTVNADYPGNGGGQACAFAHPFHALPPGGTPVIHGGDTLVIAEGSYMMGYGAPATENCEAGGSFGCYMPPLPSGPDAAHPTRILGAGHASGCSAKPELWGTERADIILNLAGTSNVEVSCLEITDHSSCVEFHSGAVPCQRETPPYGSWAGIGLAAEDSRNVRIKDLNIHGLAKGGVWAGRLTDWTVDNLRIAGNGMVGWDGDVNGDDSNSGTLTFRHLTIEWNGCGETYPAGQPTGCWAQSAGGYGDGFGTGATVGSWVFEDSAFLHNTSDGLDLLYARQGSSITLRRVHSEGNAGDQIKTNGPVTIENSIAVSNCGNFQGQTFTHDVDPCRAGGTALFLVLHDGAQAIVTNNTITGEGDVLVGGECDRLYASCNGLERIVMRNNIYIGNTEFLAPDDVSALMYQETFPQGDLLFDVDYSAVRHVKDNGLGCPGTHHTCGEAPVGLVNEGVDTFDPHLLSSSPAVNTGTSVGAPTVDFDGLPRDAQPDLGAYEYRAGSTCILSCSATVPTSGRSGTPVSFHGSASTLGCNGSVTFDWDFGDGTAHGNQATTSHTYASTGSYTWRLTAGVDSQTCAKTGTITVTNPNLSHTYLVPSIAHWPGAGNTAWRSDVTAVNLGSTAATVTLSYRSVTDAMTASYVETLVSGGTAVWRDVLVAVLGLASDRTNKGTLHVSADAPLTVASRTYNQTPDGTYGQFVPALTATGTLSQGQRGILPLLSQGTAYRTNAGIANLSASGGCSVRFRLFGPAGLQLGNPVTVSAAAGLWFQQDSIFAKAAAGNQDIAYATVEVTTPGCVAWAYASVIDQATGDPTMVPVQLP